MANATPTTGAPALKQTALHDLHVALGGKMVPFAGFEMPVSYEDGGGLKEHTAVRTRCGIFDVSHMGEFMIRGPQAAAFVSAVTTNDVPGLVEGQVHYSTILNDRGTIEDDCLVYRLPDGYMMVVNASNIAKDFAHIKSQLHNFDAELTDVSDETALLAIQGPKALDALQPLTSIDLPKIGYYHFVEGEIAGITCYISRTGYTGEDGFELYFHPMWANAMWRAITHAGRAFPCGLGARDTLRLEMGMALYGNDIDDTTTPLEANLAWLVKPAKGDFVGRDALMKQKAQGIPRKLVGLAMPRGSIARHGYPISVGGIPTGTICSGTQTPTLDHPVATCYLPTDQAHPGTRVDVEIRSSKAAGEVVKTPFYKNGSHL